MAVIDDLTTAYEQNALAIARYSQQLAADALNPLGSYSIDGENVPRDKWRQAISALLSSLIDNNKKLAPLVEEKVRIVWLGKPTSQEIPLDQRD